MFLIEICWSGPQMHLRSVAAYLFFVWQFEGRPHFTWFVVDNLGEIWSSQSYFGDGLFFSIFGTSETHIIFGMCAPNSLLRTKKELLGIVCPKSNEEFENLVNKGNIFALIK